MNIFGILSILFLNNPPRNLASITGWVEIRKFFVGFRSSTQPTKNSLLLLFSCQGRNPAQVIWGYAVYAGSFGAIRNLIKMTERSDFRKSSIFNLQYSFLRAAE